LIWLSSLGLVDLDSIQSIYDTLVSIPSGTFDMGCSPGDTYCSSGSGGELPQHTVTISNGFKMSAYEITQGQWQAVMGSNPSYFSSCGSDCPVDQVSWNTIQTFITTLNSLTGRNYRLSTEAEWEYAARAGTTTKYYCGDDESCLGSIAWYDSNAGGMTHPAGEKTPNSFGLYDMTGNVVEWVNDWYGNYSSGSFIDPQGPPTGAHRVLRGGAWGSAGIYCRSSSRGYHAPSASNNHLGFRLCLP
jgi:formylglycine-generating enzyme required for sulfatase activity